MFQPLATKRIGVGTPPQATGYLLLGRAQQLVPGCHLQRLAAGTSASEALVYEVAHLGANMGCTGVSPPRLWADSLDKKYQRAEPNASVVRQIAGTAPDS